jgi:undecaprenyl-diphosphatase
MNTLISFTAQYLYLVCAVLALLFWLRLESRERKRLTIVAVAAGGIAVVLTKLTGALIIDPRPFVVGHYSPLFSHAADNGFPSDHTVLTSLLGFLILSHSKRFGAAMLLLAFLVGASRVAAGIHHPEDIVGGFLIAGFSAELARLLVRMLWHVRNVRTSLQQFLRPRR